MKCAKCGKKFLKTSLGWGYAYGGKYACSYKCMREMEKEDTNVTEDEKKKATELSAQGVDNAQIAEELNVSRQAVGAYLGRKGRRPEAEIETVPETVKAAPEGPKTDTDELAQMVIALMTDMVEILKRIV